MSGKVIGVFLLSSFCVLLFSFLLINYLKREGIVLASPETFEIEGWQTADFAVPFKDWDNPLGIEGVNNSGLNKETCQYQIESLNPQTEKWEITHNSTKRVCDKPITVTVEGKSGDGWEGEVGLKVKTADCKYSGENTCKITAWSEDNAGNSNFGTEKMAIKIYDIDFTPPTSKIKIIRKSTGEDVTNKWLRADTYTIKFEDEDLESGVKTCEYAIHSCDKGGTYCPASVSPFGTLRDCNFSFDIKAGKDASTYNLEYVGRFRIYSRAINGAGLSAESDWKWLSFDFTPPTF